MSFLKNLSFAAAMTVAASVAGAETVLIHGEAGPNRGARADALQWFADQVAERSENDLRLDIQWGGALFKALNFLLFSSSQFPLVFQNSFLVFYKL